MLRKIEVTIRATDRTQQEKKIRMFGQLLLGSEVPGLVCDTDEFEYYLSILDELNPRELVLLSTLDKYYQPLLKMNFTSREELIEATAQYWPDMINEASDALSVSIFEIENMLERLRSKGCYEAFADGYGAPTGGVLTHTYDRIQKVIFAGVSTLDRSE